MDAFVTTADLIPAELLKRFDVPGPRYTSYPTADRFLPDSEARHLISALQRRSQKPVGAPLSLYIHLPFCESVCYYCACNKVITKDHGKVDDYLRHLEQEMTLMGRHLGEASHRQVGQLHLGGGSPTFLTDNELSRLINLLRHHFVFIDQAELSIEIDPRTVDTQRLVYLRQSGFNRLSFGVQDFDPDVQQAVHRVQPFEQVAALMADVRRLGFDSVNLDLIYGLPKQTPESFQRTLARVLEIKPDRLALYAYAHLPARFKPQRRIEASELPKAEDKVSMLDQAVRAFMQQGYDYIGMDHFALPNDQLAQVKRQGKLQRNFQGYHAHVGADLLGLGVSSISQIGMVYSQSVKTLAAYYGALAQDRLPVERGLTLDADDVLRREVIMALMCQGRLDFSSISSRYNIDFVGYFEDSLARLREFEWEGLVTRTPAGLEVSKTGWFFVRPMAMCFDKYLSLHQDHQRFSKVL